MGFISKFVRGVFCFVAFCVFRFVIIFLIDLL